MAYRALYRTYRPRRFGEVVGQEHVIRTLQNALRQGRVGHAYLFAGPRGTGKTSVARLLAKAVNCEQPVDGCEPCNDCATCESISDGTALDVIEIDAASNRGIDEIRDLREKVRYAPGRCRYKVYIIDEVHMLTDAAFNALLKTLEDPPANVVFVLATTDPQKVPATILSRCQRFDFHRVPDARIVEHLQRVCQAESLTAEPQALQVIARHARGGLRDALSLLDQAAAMGTGGSIATDDLLALLGTADEESLLALTRAAAGGDLKTGLAVIDELITAGRDPRQVLRDWQQYLRDALVLRLDAGPAGAAAMTAQQAGELRRAAAAVAPEALLAVIEYLAEREQVMRWAPDGRLVLEAAFLRAARQLGAAGGAVASPRSGQAAVQSMEPRATPAPSSPPSGARAAAGPAPVEAPAPAPPPAPAPAPATPGAAAPAADAGAAETVVAAWPTILERVRRVNTQMRALLDPSAVDVRAADPARVALVFRHEFHRKMMETGDRLRTLEKLVADTCGVRVSIHCVTMEQDPGEPPRPAGRRRSTETRRPEAAPDQDGPDPATHAEPEDAPPADEVPLPDEPPPPTRGEPGLVGEALELFGGRLVEPKEERP